MPDVTDFQIEGHALLDGVPHGFFGSAGGAHQFGFGGPGDPGAVRRLRAAAADAISAGGQLAAPHQVHSPDVVVVPAAWDDAAEGRPVADAVVTATPGIVLGIVTADSGPILFADAKAGVVGAAHAGWRGARISLPCSGRPSAKPVTRSMPRSARALPLKMRAFVHPLRSAKGSSAGTSICPVSSWRG